MPVGGEWCTWRRGLYNSVWIRSIHGRVGTSGKKQTAIAQMYSLGRWKRCQLDKDRIHSADWAMVDFLLAQKSKSSRIRTQMTLILVRMNKYFRFLINGCASSPSLASNIYGERKRFPAAQPTAHRCRWSSPMYPTTSYRSKQAHENKIYGFKLCHSIPRLAAICRKNFPVQH